MRTVYARVRGPPLECAHLPPGSSPSATRGYPASTHLAARHGARDETNVSSGKTEGKRYATRAGLRAFAFASMRSPAPEFLMLSLQALLVSTGTVALAEIGDKTQLLALLLAARYRKPWPIAWGILVATLVNHAISAWLGAELTRWLSPEVLRWGVAASFLAVALWTLKPDKLDENEEKLPAYGAFVATTIAFFLAEIGDKTQVATVLLGTRYDPLWQVIAGTTLGMLVANLPVVWLGHRFADRLPLKLARTIAALMFLGLAAWVAVFGVG